MEIKYPKAIFPDEDDEVTVELQEEQLIKLGVPTLHRLDIRSQGSLAGKAFYLPIYYDWIIVREYSDNLCLVPLRKA